MKTLTKFILLFILVSIYIFPSSSFAADYGLSISPPLLRVHIKPGKAITQVFKIENLSTTDKTLIANITPFSESDDLGNPVLNPKATASWLTYFNLVNTYIRLNEPFTLKAGASEQLILSLTVPENAPLADVYATLLISTYNNTPLNSAFQGTSVNATIGSNMLITISSIAFPDTILKIEKLIPTSGSFIKIGNLYFADSITPLTFSATVKNEGKFTTETKGVFRVSTGKNVPVFLQGVLPVYVIANSQRLLVDTNGENFSFSPNLSQVGLHQITVEIKTDNSNTSSTIDIFFFPLKLSLAIVLSLIIVLIIVKITSKSSEKSLDNIKKQ